MLVNWYISEFGDDHYLKSVIGVTDLKLLAAQFCTHLLAAGVLCQLPDKDVPQESLFRVSTYFYVIFIYYLILSTLHHLNDLLSK